MASFIIHWLTPVGILLILVTYLFLDCEHAPVEAKKQDDSPCEIKDNIRGRKIFLALLGLLLLVWIVTPLKK
jgi:hypothetical protein